VTRAFILACSLLWAMVVVGESVEVTQIKPQQSSRHVRIAVTLNGHVVKGAKVDLCRFVKQDQLCFSVLTGEDGIAATPKLADGDYTVGASVDDDTYEQLYGGDLYLHVSGHGGQKSFTVDLTKSFRAAQAVAAAADALPVKERLQEFQGSLRDPSGAPIAGVSIRIIRKGSAGHAIVQKLKSNDAGQFSSHLDDGVYIAFFTFPGFRTRTIPFEIINQGAKELRITLQIGTVT
jgi:5-hydroxyisourate hydrolase-like protein (transthyretin family)